MTVKYIHRGIVFYVSCTINSILATGWSAANQYELQHGIAGCPMGIPQQSGCATGVSQCQLPNWRASFHGKKSKCWLHFICLLDFHLFFNTSARNSFALLFSAHDWLSTIAWCNHLQHSCLLVSKYSNRERGAVLCGSFSVTWLLGRFFFFSLPHYADKK